MVNASVQLHRGEEVAERQFGVGRIDSPENFPCEGPDAGRYVDVWHPSFITAPLPSNLRALAEQMGFHGVVGAADDNPSGYQHDLDAIEGFLSHYADPNTGKPNRTAVAYRREIERALKWSVGMRNKSLSELTVADAEAYAEFLRDPQPRQLWVAVNCRPRRGEPQWRPFNFVTADGLEPTGTCGLSGSSWVRAVAALQSMFEYWFEIGYVDRNVIRQSRIARGARDDVSKERRRKVAGRTLQPGDWDWIAAHVNDWPRDTESRRLRYMRARILLQFLRMTGVRLEEIARLRMGDIQQIEGQGDLVWIVWIKGKGRKVREVVLPDVLIDEIAQWRLALGLPSPLPEREETAPLLCALKGFRPGGELQALRENSIYKLLKQIFQGAAELMRAEGAEGHSRVAAASTHWLRHTYATSMNRKKARMSSISEMLGHADAATTRIYTDVFDDELVAEVNDSATPFGGRTLEELTGRR